MSLRDQHFRILLDALRHQIETALVPGERLPSERDLAAMHGVGPTTIHRALQDLTAEGHVKPMSYVGWFRAPAGNSSAPDSSVPRSIESHALSVGLMTRRSAEEWPDCEIYPALLAEAQSRRIKVVEIPNRHVYRHQLKRNRIELARIPWNTFDVGLLVEAEDTIRLREPELLEHRVLAVDQDATEYGIDSAIFANAQGGAMVAKHLLDLGHLRFAVTEEITSAGFSADPAKLARRHGFELKIGEAGGMIMPQWRIPVAHRGLQGAHPNFAKAAVASWLAAPPANRPTALFAGSHEPLISGKLIEELGRHGVRAPRDFSIVAVTWNGKFWGGVEPAIDGLCLTCVDFNLAALVSRVFDAAIELAKEKRQPAPNSRRAPRLFLAPATLLQGKSTAQAPHAARSSL